MTQVHPRYQGLAANDPTVDPVMDVARRFLIPVTLVGGVVAALFIAWMVTL